MKLHHEFDVSSDIDSVWAAFNDLEGLVHCLPGAALDSQDGDSLRGSISVKIGPVSAKYAGQASFELRDASRYQSVLVAKGADTRGQGNVSARITSAFTSMAPGVTHVEVDTDLAITGKVAQFGRGIIGDVSNKIVAEFAKRVEALVSGDGVAAVPAGSDDLRLADLIDVPALRIRAAVGTAVLVAVVIAIKLRRRRG